MDPHRPARATASDVQYEHRGRGRVLLVRRELGAVHLGEVAAVDPHRPARAAASDLQYEHRGRGRVLLVRGELGADQELVAVELGRPMALLTRLAGRPQSVDRARDGP